MSANAKNPRAVACDILLTVIADGKSLPNAIAPYSQHEQKSFIQEICYGSVRFYPLLDGVLSKLLKKPFKNKDKDLHLALITGLYQLHYMRVPPHAAVSETVKLTGKFGKTWAKGLINGVMRNAQRDMEDLVAQLPAWQAQALPEWLFKKIDSDWPDYTTAICAAFKTTAPLTLRVNQQHLSSEQYLQHLADADIGANKGAISNSAVVIENAIDVSKLPGFADGVCSVQDEATQLAGFLINADKPQRILDACAAPGGKTGHLAELNPSAHIVAIDNDQARLERVNENLQRLQLNADVICGDASQPNDWWDGQLYDAILLDAPCSATGVIRRNPDIKLLRRPSDIEQLPQLQLSILKALWACLKPGGLMVYATCSIINDENDAVIANAISVLPDIRVELINADWGITTEYGRQLLPTTGGHDGFYYATLRKG